MVLVFGQRRLIRCKRYQRPCEVTIFEWSHIAIKQTSICVAFKEFFKKRKMKTNQDVLKIKRWCNLQRTSEQKKKKNSTQIAIHITCTSNSLNKSQSVQRVTDFYIYMQLVFCRNVVFHFWKYTHFFCRFLNKRSLKTTERETQRQWQKYNIHVYGYGINIETCFERNQNRFNF